MRTAEPDDVVLARLDEVVNLHDFEALARERMAPDDFDYYAGGSWDEVTLDENVAAFRRRRLRPRVLMGVSRIDTSTSVLGQRMPVPFGVAPTSLHGLAHEHGEVATASGAASEGALFCLSTVSTRSIEDVAREAPPGPRWFQLYVHKDRTYGRRFVERAAAEGYSALVLTVDLPLLGRRERDVRSRFESDVPFGNYLAEGGAPTEDLGELLDTRQDASLSWDDVAWVRSLSDLPLVIKGILGAEDARLAVEHGAAALVVSNHGGRQLDRAPASIDVLEEVVEAVDGRAEVYLDSGVRRGADVLVALALGARFVFVGRPILYALAAGGSLGVARALSLLRDELATTMALLGARNVSEVTRDRVV
jgi:isopentenyl diphosphate isomerase/L-lactate dehydrogenase-like FMN-dependent dehydrogenase